MNKKILTGIITLILVLDYPLWGQVKTLKKEEDKIQKARTVVSEWVKTRQIISKEKNDWTEKKSSIIYMIELLKNEIEALDIQIEESKEEATQADIKRVELEDEEAALRNASRVVDAVVADYEVKVQSIAKTLPDPLKEKLEPLLDQIPENPKKTRLSAGERMAIVIGTLNEIDKFNNSLTVISELRDMPDGVTTSEVKTIYIGLAQAYYVDSKAKIAGIGTPSEDGWVWEENTDLAASISRSIAIYENIIKPAEFVDLPVSIK